MAPVTVLLTLLPSVPVKSSLFVHVKTDMCKTGLVMFFPLGSGPNDHVFVYFTDHGAPGLLAFPNDDVSTFYFLWSFLAESDPFRLFSHTTQFSPKV